MNARPLSAVLVLIFCIATHSALFCSILALSHDFFCIMAVVELYDCEGRSKVSREANGEIESDFGVGLHCFRGDFGLSYNF